MPAALSEMAEYALQVIRDFSLAPDQNGPAPEHIGLIVDGNRRFARGRSCAEFRP